MRIIKQCLLCYYAAVVDRPCDQDETLHILKDKFTPPPPNPHTWLTDPTRFVRMLPVSEILTDVHC